MNKELIKKVHVVFMTHFDMGFTDFAGDVLHRYNTEFIPAAIDLAEELNKDGKRRFVWTLGAFLIHSCLKEEEKSGKNQLISAINRGDICWHGMAFTTHTELMDQDLLHFDLNYADALDERFHKKSIAAKLTDVPGHTKAMIPILESHGMKYLHIGVNASSMNPKVPASFLWKMKESEIIVQYSKAYGDTCYIDGMDEVLEYVFMGDNLGIPTKEQILAKLNLLEKTYPNAVVEASTLDAYAKKVLEKKHEIPVITEEIGDSWIHGIATDPVKVSELRRLLELKNKWKEKGIFHWKDEKYFGFMEHLLMVCEHTWGMDAKKHYLDFKNWKKEDFAKARKENHVSEALFTERNTALLHAVCEEKGKEHFTSSYEIFEGSHKEQREYLKEAVRQLPKEQESEALAWLEEKGKEINAEMSLAEEVHIFEPIEINGWKVSFGGDGSMASLEKDSKAWITSGTLGRLSYETYSPTDCIAEYYQYNHSFEENMKWSEADFSKPGLEVVEDLVSRNYPFGVKRISRMNDIVVIDLSGNQKSVKEYGCPAEARITYEFKEEITIRLIWKKKDANKMPEALWFDVNLDVENPYLWNMVIMESEISPYEVAKGGNRRQHCVEKMVYDGADGTIEIINRDTPLISVGGRRLYGNCLELPDMKQGYSYCLFNNKWGTNFPMWCEDDCGFEFVMKLKNK